MVDKKDRIVSWGVVISYLNIGLIFLIALIPLLIWELYLRYQFLYSDSVALSPEVKLFLIVGFSCSIVLSIVGLILLARSRQQSNKLVFLNAVNTSALINYIFLVLVARSCESFGFSEVTDGFTICRGWPLPTPQRIELFLFFLGNMIFWFLISFLAFRTYGRKGH